MMLTCSRVVVVFDVMLSASITGVAALKRRRGGVVTLECDEARLQCGVCFVHRVTAAISTASNNGADSAAAKSKQRSTICRMFSHLTCKLPATAAQETAREQGRDVVGVRALAV